jgi:hypothetical protein
MAGARADLGLDAAKAAIASGNVPEARRALWAAVRLRPAWKSVAAALALTLAPGPSMRFLRDRMP